MYKLVLRSFTLPIHCTTHATSGYGIALASPLNMQANLIAVISASTAFLQKSKEQFL